MTSFEVRPAPGIHRQTTFMTPQMLHLSSITENGENLMVVTPVGTTRVDGSRLDELLLPHIR